MMTIEKIIEKEKFYENKINELQSTNIEEEVNKKLEEKRKEVENEVIAEINSDMMKCKDYLEILSELHKEFDEESKINEVVDSTSSESAVESQEVTDVNN